MSLLSREPVIHCRTCGGPVAKGTGQQSPEPEFSADQIKERQMYEHGQKTLPAEFGGWRWTCDTCVADWKNQTVNASALRALIGVNESESVAVNVIFGLVRRDWNTGISTGHITAEAIGAIGKSPWAHVPQNVRDELQTLYAAEKTKGLLTACKDGACGMCGVHAAKAWFTGPSCLTWPDGSRAPMCGTCNDVHERRGSPDWIEDVRKVGAEAATGKPIDLAYSAPEGFRLYCESRAADRDGRDTAWSYSEKLTEFIDSVWTWNSHLAPANRRADFDRRREALLLEQRLKSVVERREREAVNW